MSWRSSRAFHTLQIRMLYVIGVSIVGGLGVLIVAKQKGEFGKQCSTTLSLHAALVLIDSCVLPASQFLLTWLAQDGIGRTAMTTLEHGAIEHT